MSKVFLPQQSRRFDLSDAKRYGEIVVLCGGGIDPFRPNEVADSMLDDLVDYNPEEDHLCMTGNVLLLSIMVGTALTLHEKIKLLMFDARTGDYVSRILERPCI